MTERGSRITPERATRKRRIAKWLRYLKKRLALEEDQAFADALGCKLTTPRDWIYYKDGNRGPTLDAVFLMFRLDTDVAKFFLRDPTPDELATGTPHQDAANESSPVRRRHTARAGE